MCNRMRDNQRKKIRIVRKVTDATEVNAGYCWEIL